MNEAILQALQEVEASQGARLHAMNREIRNSRTPPTRKDRVPVIIQEGRLGAYYDVLQHLAQADRDTTLEAFRTIIRPGQEWLRPDELAISHILGARFRACFNHWQDTVLLGIMPAFSSSTALVSLAMGMADAARTAFDLPLVPYNVEAKPE